MLTFIRRLLALAALALVGLVSYAQEGNRSIRVLDGHTGSPLESVHLILGPSVGIYTDAHGQASLPRHIGAHGSIIVRYIGYEELTLSTAQVLRSSGPYTIRLRAETTTLDALVVQGRRRAVSLSTISQRIGADEIHRQAGRSLADLLEQVSGVSSIRTGTNTAKPVIHGMHGNRILIVNNGVRQSGQQWGDGHAPEVDLSSSHAIHVVKGAESVRYGSEALGGIIVMEQKALPYGARHWAGHISSLYGSNGHRHVHTASVEGSIPGLPRLAWRVQGMYANSGDHATARYLLNNTGSRELNLSALIGYDAGALRIEGFYSRYDSRHGVMLSAQLGSVEHFRERIAWGRPLPETLQPFTRSIGYPHEHVVHHTLTGKAIWHTNGWGTLLYQLSLQRDIRKEYRIRRNFNSHIPEVDLLLSNLQHRLRWEHTYGHWQTELGAQYIHTDNHSIPGNGVTPVIPNYVEQAWGVYAVQRYHRDRLTAEAGLRIDGQATEAAGYDFIGQYYGGRRTFGNVSYSLGAHYRASSRLTLTTNLGVAWRAPHVHELYSNGHDHGSAAFVLGDSTLASEQSYKWVSSISYRHKWINLSLDGYLQWVHHYIYDEPQIAPDGTPELRTIISGAYPIFRYKQTQALLRGLDLQLELRPLPWLSYSLTTALIYANEARTGAYLPFIPPLRIDQQVSLTLGTCWGWKPRLSIGHRFVDKQRRFEPTKDLLPYTPDAYHLLSAELSLERGLGSRSRLRIALGGDNLLNHEYKEYTNRARYYSHDLGRDLRLSLGWHF